jgi:hypothetical protein
MTKLEEVARAIYEGRNGPGARPWAHLQSGHKAPYRTDARAAIEALHSPSSELLYAAELRAEGLGDGGGFVRGSIGEEWYAMIDAILSEGTAPAIEGV